CKTYWRSPHKRGRETTPEQMAIPALGHSYDGGKCTRCGKTDPELLHDTKTIPDLTVSSEGVLTWGGIKIASKYRIEITDEDNNKHTYDVSDSEETALDLTKLSDEYELTYGKNYMSITAYQPYEEKVDGETIADDIPVSESKTDFIAIKQNSGYTLTTLNYADEYITVNGAYGDMRKDGEKQYILIEQQIAADKQSVSFNLANKVKTANGVSVSYYSDENCTQSISKDEWRFMSVPAGTTDIYLKANGSDGERSYVVRVMTVKPVEVNLIKVEKLAAGYNYTTLTSSSITVLENDYIDMNMFYSKVSSSSQLVVDADFNAYDKTDDCVMPQCQGKIYNFYVVEESYLNRVTQNLEKYGETFNCKFVWGDGGSPAYWTLTLRNDYTKKGVIVPGTFGNYDPVLLTTNTLGYNNTLEKVVFEEGVTALNSTVFAGCTQLKEVYIPNSAKDNLGDFLFPAALKDTLTVYCCNCTIPNDKWNQISGAFGKYFETVQNASRPSDEEITD
ncbi:MAG: leucine-rich repeat domain-containing protein, partial [Clostridia bacterium]|nr:leucine-rich repeat domain-containing protein [Clostridia bacterium]